MESEFQFERFNAEEFLTWLEQNPEVIAEIAQLKPDPKELEDLADVLRDSLTVNSDAFTVPAILCACIARKVKSGAGLLGLMTFGLFRIMKDHPDLAIDSIRKEVNSKTKESNKKDDTNVLDF